MEALCFLKRRGVLLAIVSKNDEGRIAGIWDTMTHGLIRLDDFAVRRINWRPKAQNLEEIIAEVNVLPRNVLYIDDNPVERASVKAELPDVRILDGRYYYWRRMLLWAPEIQVAAMTDESVRRTEMVQAQVVRETSRRSLPREEFLASLAVRLRLFEVDSADHRSFPRAFELLNKANQFNTTGRRWTEAEFLSAMRQGLRMFAFEVEDKYTSYGLVGVAVIGEWSIEQFVMSCRVIGLDVEIAAVAEIARRIFRGRCHDLIGRLTATDANGPCLDLFSRCGFASDGEGWIMPSGGAVETPRHVAVS